MSIFDVISLYYVASQLVLPTEVPSLSYEQADHKGAFLLEAGPLPE